MNVFPNLDLPSTFSEGVGHQVFESGLSGHSEGIFFSVGRLNLIYLFNSLLPGVGAGGGKLVLVLKEKIFPTNTFFSITSSVGRTHFHT